MGALTNIAMAVRKEPRLARRVQQVVLMGGGYHAGNRTPVAEFNIWVDPESAHVVFNEDWPLLMVGLDLTHQALATAEVTRSHRGAWTRRPRASWAACWGSTGRRTSRGRASTPHRCTTRARWPT